MSNFGAGINLIKKNHSTITDEEMDLLNHHIDQLIEEGEYANALGDEFIFDIHVDEEDNVALFIMLTEYWLGQGTSNEQFDFTKASDLPQAIEISEKLKEILGDGFDIEPIFDYW
ncbi:MAG: hypothetical protein KA198_09830 [Chitinophagaceae bacterium]|nr:hypothetical protein [Chitinophagaceae bacterium]